MAFLKDTDFDMQIKQELRLLLDSSQDGHAQKRATDTAISQMRNYLGSSFDFDKIFVDAPEVENGPDNRDQFMVTLVIDLLLYHLYSKNPTSQLPEHRSLRYQDAINWLRDVGTGKMKSTLPKIITENGKTKSDVRIWSKRPPSNHKY